MTDSFHLELGRRGPGFPGPQTQLGAKLRGWVLLRERGQQPSPPWTTQANLGVSPGCLRDGSDLSVKKPATTQPANAAGIGHISLPKGFNLLKFSKISDTSKNLYMKTR